MRGVLRFPVRRHVPLAGSYSSAVPSNPRLCAEAWPTSPPTTSTWPLVSSVAVWPERAALSAPVTVHIPETGSYSSALLSTPELPRPPETRTLPLGSNVAVWPVRATLRLPVESQLALRDCSCVLVPETG